MYLFWYDILYIVNTIVPKVCILSLHTTQHPLVFPIEPAPFQTGNHGFTQGASAPAYLEPCDGLPSTFARGLALCCNHHKVHFKDGIPK